MEHRLTYGQIVIVERAVSHCILYGRSHYNLLRTSLLVAYAQGVETAAFVVTWFTVDAYIEYARLKAVVGTL